MRRATPGRILVNDKVAKASLNVKPGDIIEIQFGNRNTKVEVLSINETYKKDEAKELYRYVVIKPPVTAYSEIDMMPGGFYYVAGIFPAGDGT